MSEASEFLSQLVTRSGKTQAVLAKAMKISPQFLCDILSGRRDVTPKIIKAAVHSLYPGNLTAQALVFYKLHHLAAKDAGFIVSRFPDGGSDA